MPVWNSVLEPPGPKILIVNDDFMNRDMRTQRPEPRGFQVLAAVDGREGIARARAESPALILIDVNLPGLDGWQATRRLKAGPETRQIPVMALTAHAMLGDREKAEQAGRDDYETKPVGFPRLLRKMESLLTRGITA